MVYVCYVDKSIRGRSLNIYFEIILRTLDLSRYYLKEVINYWYKFGIYRLVFWV